MYSSFFFWCMEANEKSLHYSNKPLHVVVKSHFSKENLTLYV